MAFVLGGCFKADIGETRFDLAGSVIVLPDQPEKWERCAAEDLAEAIRKTSGAVCRMVGESACGETDAVRVYVGKTRAASQSGIDFGCLSEQEFRVKTLPGRLFVAGGTPTGTSYGVSDLLASRFGIYELDAGVVVVPTGRHLELPVGLDYVRKPAIRSREVYRRIDDAREVSSEAYGDLMRFRRRNYLTAVRSDLPPDCRPTGRLNPSHSFHQLLPPEKFSKAHPEWFSMTKDGRRTFSRFGGQLCLTNPEMRKEAARRLLEIIAADRAGDDLTAPPGLYEVSQCDDSPECLCACEKCRAKVEELGGENGLLLDFVNELAAQVAKRYPDVSIRTFAYECTERPSKIAPAPNVIVRYCDFYSRHVDLYPLEAAENAKQLALYRSWIGRKCRLEIWDYLLYNFSSGAMAFEVGLPATSVDSIIGDMRLFARTGLERVFVEAEYARRHPKSFRKLEYFLLAQLMFDPAQDAERLIDTFVRGYYGAAAEEVGRYLALLRTAQNANRTTLVLWKQRNFAHLTPSFVAEAAGLLADAYAKAKDDPVVAARVADEYVNVLRAQMGLAGGRTGGESDFARAEALCRELDDVRVRAAGWMSAARREEFAAALRAEHDVYGARAYGELPAEVKGLDPMKLVGVPVTCRVVSGNAKVAKDPDSPMRTSVFWQPPQGSRHKHGLPYQVSLFAGKGSVRTHRIAEVPSDGRYHWYRIGSMTLTRQAYVLLSSDWRQRVMLGDFFFSGEGADNSVDVWVSMRFRGPAYVKGATGENEAVADRVLLVRR